MNTFVPARDALRFAGLTPPERPYALTDSTPRTGVMIFPDAERPGAIEELLLDTCAKDPVHPEAARFVDAAVRLLQESCSPNHKPPAPHKHGKARIHAFSAAFDDPDQHLGIAAQAGVWDFTHPSLAPIHALLTQM